MGAVWLTPVYESPMVDNGYDVEDYYKINPRYGTMEDMDRLTDSAVGTLRPYEAQIIRVK